MTTTIRVRLHVVLVALVATAATLLPLPTATTATAAETGDVEAPAIVPFEEWAPDDCPRPENEDPRPTKRLVVHHTYRPVAETRADVVPALARVCESHVERGMHTIAYHYVVDPWGGVWQARGGMPDENGRPPAVQGQGAHVAGSNPAAVGVVFLGDHDVAPPTAAALDSASELLAWLLSDLDLDPSETVADWSTGLGTSSKDGRFEVMAVAGHLHSNVTACPGEHLTALLPELRTASRKLLQGESPMDWSRVMSSLDDDRDDDVEPEDHEDHDDQPEEQAEEADRPDVRRNAAPHDRLAARKAPSVRSKRPARSVFGALADALGL